MVSGIRRSTLEDRKDKERRPGSDREGYGGGRQRAEQTPDHGFGDRGFGQGAGSGDRKSGETQPESEGKQLPEGIKAETGGPGWDERFVDENADKYGQAGGQPTAQRGPSQSTGGHEQEPDGLGDTSDLSPRGGVGIRETEKRPGEPEKNK
jgi:hypothetical protein